MKVAVLNPQGNDPDQSFPDSAGDPDERVHPPVNYHGFAACSRSGFFRDPNSIPDDTRAVILVLTHSLKRANMALTRLRREKRVVVLAWKEAGAHQVAQQLANPRDLALFRELCERSDGAIATTPDLIPFFHGGGASRVEFIPTPYPVEDVRWDCRRSDSEKRGILIGTREFFVSTRNHLAALLLIKRLAEGMGEPVTVFNFEGWRGRRILSRLGYAEGMLKVIEHRLPYPQWLRAVAKHRFVFQLDSSTVPGQVAGDALLARVPCVGGYGTTERLVFPDLCGWARTHEQIFDIAARLMEHPRDCAEYVAHAEELARSTVSFTHVADALTKFFAPLLR
jgi:hypothetical protein